MGTFCIITDAATIGTVIGVMSMRLGDITIMPLFGGKDTAERALVSGRLGTRGIGVIHRGLSMNNGAILRDGLTIAKALGKVSDA